MVDNHPLKGTICSGPQSWQEKAQSHGSQEQSSITQHNPAGTTAPQTPTQDTCLCCKAAKTALKEKEKCVNRLEAALPLSTAVSVESELSSALQQTCLHWPFCKIQSGLPGSWGNQHFSMNYLHSDVMDWDCSCHYFKWLEATRSPISLAAFINRSYT